MAENNKYDWEDEFHNKVNGTQKTNSVLIEPNTSPWTFIPQSSIPQLGVVSVKNIAKALLTAQRNIGAAVKDSKNPFFKSSYADLNSVMEACKQHLNDVGIVVTQPVSSDGSSNYVETILTHADSGEQISSKIMLIPPKDMQQLGSAISYARRYGLQSLVFMGAEDNDAEGTMSREVKAPPVKQETKPVSSFKKQPTPTVEQPPQTTLTPVQENKGEEW